MEQPPPAGPPDDQLPPPPPRFQPRWTPPKAAASAPPPGPPPLVRPVGGRRPKRWWFAAPVAIAVYFLLALFTFAQPINIASLSLSVPIPGLPPERIFGLPNRPFTVMVIGLDIRPTQSGPSRTDSILLIRVDGDRNRAGVLSIPRDTMMEIPLDDGSSYTDRINTAYVYNWAADNARAAPDALAATIDENLGIKVDFYISFDQRGAEKIIDAAGGVTVMVRPAFGQDNYSDDDVHVVPQYFPEGKQHLGGYEAVAYGRIREGTSDFDRIRRQQQVVEGLVSHLSSPASFFTVWRVYGAYHGAVKTDLSMRQSAGLFAMLKRIGTDRIVTRSLGDAAVSCVTCPAALVQLLPDETARIISEAFDDEAAGQTAAELLVQAGVTP